MKPAITLALLMASTPALALTANVEGTLRGFQDVEKLLCKDATPAMAQVNIQAGMDLLILAINADEAEKAGDLAALATAKENIEKVQAGSKQLSEAFNAKCVKLEEVFMEVESKPEGTGN